MGKIFKTELTEEKIIEILMNDFQKSSKYKIPNLYIFNWESDLICSNINDELLEFEIKATRRDFKKDFDTRIHHTVF